VPQLEQGALVFQHVLIAPVARAVAFVRVLQRTGSPLEEIKQAFSRYLSGNKLTAAQWRELSSHWRKELDARITRLQRICDELDTCIGCGCLSPNNCPLYNPCDQPGQEGPGARILARV